MFPYDLVKCSQSTFDLNAEFIKLRMSDGKCSTLPLLLYCINPIWLHAMF